MKRTGKSGILKIVKIAMGKSGVFDPTFLVLQTQFCLLEMLNPKLFALLLRNWL